MVDAALPLDIVPFVPEVESDELETEIDLDEIKNAGVRLEASAFNIEAHNAMTALETSGLPLISLYGAEGLCQEAHNAFRFKRIYVSPEQGVPFITSSEIISFKPRYAGFLSRKLTRKLDVLFITKWDVLISCSGTIGNIGFATDTFAGKALSQDTIRLRANDSDTAGYIVAFLRSRYGRPQIIQVTYGSVIPHIEPVHLQRVVIPDLHTIRRIEIGRSMCKAGELRDEANRLLDEADRLLHDRLNLPYLTTIAPDTNASVETTINVSEWQRRLEGSFMIQVLLPPRSNYTLYLSKSPLSAMPESPGKYGQSPSFASGCMSKKVAFPCSAVSNCFRLIRSMSNGWQRAHTPKIYPKFS